MKRFVLTLYILILSALTLSAGIYRYAVIPVEFSDVSFSDAKSGVEAKVSTAENYFNSQFGSARTFSFEVLPTVKLPSPRSHYGSNGYTLRDVGLDEAVRAACTQSRADFSLYDNDGDGFVDNVCLVVAGASESDGGGTDCIWPQQAFLHDRGGTLSLGAKTADSFTVCSEFSSVAVFCHEFCHHLGLQDMYDTDGPLSGGTSKGLWGSLSIMDNGGHLANFSAVELDQLGLGNRVAPNEGRFILMPISSRQEYIRIDTDNPGEYFLLECRDRNGWDSNLGGRGLVIYHVDRSAADSWYSDMYRRNLSAAERWSLNQVNCRPEHQCVRVLEAVPGTSDFERVFFPQEGRISFGSETDPPFRSWAGVSSSLAIMNISLAGSGEVSFDIVTPLQEVNCEVFQDAAILVWDMSAGLDISECSVSWSSTGLENNSRGSKTVYPDSDGHCSAAIEGLKPQTSYTVAVRVYCKDGATYSKNLEFRTKVYNQSSRPFIYLNSLERNPDGSFKAGSYLPLRVYNAPEARRVDWFFNGIRIYPLARGYWQLETSGTLTAEIYHPDGTRETITKRMNVQ